MAGLGLIISKFGADERGATAIEYGLIAGLIGLGAIVAFTGLGDGITDLFNYVIDTAGAAIDNAF